MVSKFAQVIPTDASHEEVQKAIENKDDPLWVMIKERFVSLKKILTDLIALGKYSEVDRNIFDRDFNSSDFKVGLEPKLFHFDDNISVGEIITEMDREGYRPGTLGDLLSYGANNPHKNTGSWIMALGSIVIFGDRRVAVCIVEYSTRELELTWAGGKINPAYFFLAVRK
ncbi:MAG: hypothetical protein COV01_03405 [Candidatus Taylorbacteria bacterium CG10_big_fil_rev_8_21_14_0_10_41_48]|uniref:Uncharacterized protein n=1 Tax=Candidatus Taylorbacteria bacterium CG10_big_fil_rev_8_21_14_0_10_41_48 TaxID=1975024 RepID=A0A2M8LB99_9BACT|nr:MAG: hypothetical protein COV01_03405 [Candidatus Taylorbacteria bacterium CG10_big_fil_rev_8_21_14_0_10_41_48]